MIYKSEIKISKEKFDRVNRLLAEIDFNDDSEEMEELIYELGATEDAWECGWEFKFEDGAEIFIDIRSGSSNYYDDMMWQKDNDEQLLDCEYELNEEIEFEIDEHTNAVQVKNLSNVKNARCVNLVIRSWTAKRNCCEKSIQKRLGK